MNKGVDIFSLRGKTALITGATGHLGVSIGYILAEAGAHVIVNSRSEAKCALVTSQLEADGLSAEVAAFDIASHEAVTRFVTDMKNRPLHILVNNAYFGRAGNIEEADAESYSASYEVSVIAAHRLLQSLLPNLRNAVLHSGAASVINIASMYALVSPDQRIYDSSSSVNPPFYGAAKAALLQWTRYAACEFGHEGIRINAIAPGPFPSEEVQMSNPELVNAISKKVPMGRIGLSTEIKGPALFLASDAASFVNGATIVVDGGWTCW